MIKSVDQLESDALDAMKETTIVDAESSQLLSGPLNGSTRFNETGSQPDAGPSSTVCRNNIDKHSFYVSKFSNRTSDADFKDFITKRGITNFNDFHFRALVPPNIDRSTLTFISYKVDITSDLIDKITACNFWPSGCFIKPFVQKPPPIVDLTKCDNNPSTGNFRYAGRKLISTRHH